MDKTNNQLKFIIVGHVDHGKSTLIGRLLLDTNSISQAKIDEVTEICEALGKPFKPAFLMDHLTEERQKNITIDTAQTFFKTDKQDYVIIDAPGHKEFLKNMITGATLAEAAILIVDADEGVKEQTKRHAYMLSLLGVDQLIVVVNKMDKIDFQEDKFNKAKDNLQNHLKKVNLSANYLIPISSKQGDNIVHKSDKFNWYSGPTVLEALDSFKNKLAENLPLRLPVQDKYDDILLGQIASGVLNKNDEVIIFPSEQKTSIKEIKKWQQTLDKAEAGDNIGITLTDKIDVKRGDIICDTDNLPKVTNEFKATIFWMSKDSLKTDEAFSLKLATQETSVQIKKIHKLMDSSTLEQIDRTSEIKETEVAEVDIKTDKKIVIEDFNYIPELGRLVIVKNEDISGGGIINLN